VAKSCLFCYLNFIRDRIPEPDFYQHPYVLILQECNVLFSNYFSGVYRLLVLVVRLCLLHWLRTSSFKATGLKTGSIILGILGVAVITLGRKSLPSGAETGLLGVSFLLLNNLVSGITNVVIARERQTISPLVLKSASLFIGGAFLFLISVPIEGIPHKIFPPEYFVALLLFSLLSAAAISICNTLLRGRHVKVSELNIWKFLIPVSGTILSWIILPKESPDLVFVLCMVLIAFLLLLLNLPNMWMKHDVK
jgi:drug/metabolite transporter (DMT)-like permease